MDMPRGTAQNLDPGAVMHISVWFDRDTALHKTSLSNTIGNIM